VTFDDGPDPTCTPAILDVLSDKGAKATFFLLVDKARAHETLVRSIVTNGHEVALHGDVHERLDRLSTRVLVERLSTARAELEDIAGSAVGVLRPPFGRTSLRVLRAARKVGLHVALWTHSPRDWDASLDDLLSERMAMCAMPGAIVLLHDGSGVFKRRPGSTRSLGTLLDSAAEQELEPVTLTQR
jgi:peptidoglycan/xylan/chitin deacetylase (PgdA/CDA1 family)